MREHQKWDVSPLISAPLLDRAFLRKFEVTEKKRRERITRIKTKMREYRRRIKDLQAKLDAIE